MPVNNFVPEYIKKLRTRQKRVARVPIEKDELQEKNNLKKRTEEIISNPDYSSNTIIKR